jgi:hypothetical protein
VRDRKSDSTAGALHESRYDDGGQPRPEDEYRKRQARGCLPSGDLLGKQRSGGSAGGKTKRPEQLGGYQHPDGSPLDGGERCVLAIGGAGVAPIPASRVIESRCVFRGKRRAAHRCRPRVGAIRHLPAFEERLGGVQHQFRADSHHWPVNQATPAVMTEM